MRKFQAEHPDLKGVFNDIIYWRRFPVIRIHYEKHFQRDTRTRLENRPSKRIHYRKSSVARTQSQEKDVSEDVYQVQTRVQMEAHIPFILNVQMQSSCAQMNRADPGTSQTYTNSHDEMVQDHVQYNYLSHITVPPMERMSPETSDSLINVNESSIPLIPQTTTGPEVREIRHKRTSFTKVQHEELESLFSHTMFLDKNLQKKVALKLSLPESTVKNWFKNRRLKWRKQNQQEQPLKLSKKKLLYKKLPDLPQPPRNAHTSYPAVSDTCGCSHTHPLGPSSWTQDSIMTPSLPSDIQMHDPQLESLEASVPALFPDSYDITQIMKLYSFPDEELTSSSFECLYQYLSPKYP
ncbi:arginine-fifty homeobox [Sorex fumeus]|uniref:arginine-fifty homeobox n=1 Tax=Sorex fumeus TaxID=62283 RepID=UPI0024ACAB74|nr:arginine-fifty homeobox [Sorex fumeus]